MAQPRASHATLDAGLPLAIRALAPDERDAATALLAAGMRENPLHVHANGTLLGACVDGELVGVLGMLEPGRCRPTRMETLRMASAIIVRNSPTRVWRIQRWLSAWTRNDPAELHAHIGPLAVLPAWRRQGVGRELMVHCCRRVDALGVAAWLETDLAINVAFYETLGFVVTRREAVVGVPNWFMRRPSA